MMTSPCSSAPRRDCLRCGTHVSEQFQRVFVDDRDRVYRCPECDTFLRLSRGSAAGLDVEFPDPLESPNRQGNETGRCA